MSDFARTAPPRKGSQTFGLGEAAMEQDLTGKPIAQELAERAAAGEPFGRAASRTLSRRVGAGLDRLRSAGDTATRDEMGRLLMMTPEDIARALDGFDGIQVAPRLRDAGGRAALIEALAAKGRSSGQRQPTPQGRPR
jgi:hypothetical protein